MTFIPQARITRIQARITSLEAQLVVINAAILSISEVKEYRFDSGEGSQRVQYRRLGELTKESGILERELAHLYRKLQGTGIVNLNLRR